MSPAIAAQPEGAVHLLTGDTRADTTEPAAVLAEEINEQILAGLEEEQQLPPSVLASLFLVLGVVVFIAVMMKRMSTRPEMMQCSGHMKSHIYSYGSVNFHLDDMYQREYGKWGFLKQKQVSMKTRPSSFISVSEIWKAQQSKNQHLINKIVEEPEDDGSNWKIVNESEGRR